MTTFLIFYALGWIGFSSIVILLFGSEPHPHPRGHVLTIAGLGAIWPLWVAIFLWMLIAG